MVQIKISVGKIILLLLSAYLLKGFFFGETQMEITDKEFEKMLSNNEAEEIVLYSNTKTVFVYPKKKKIADSIKRIVERKKNEEIRKNINSPFYSTWLDKVKDSYYNLKNNIDKVIFILKVPSVKIFNENYKEIEKKIPEENRIGYKTKEKTFLFPIIASVAHFLFTLALIFMIFNPGVMFGGKSGGFGGFLGKNKNRGYDPLRDNKVTFKDIAGMKEVKEEVSEIVNYFKFKKNIASLGGQIPKGFLLVGPPGNGKTLLAKAIAGEAKIPFLFSCGSDFSGIYWGMGTMKVNALFDEAEKLAPCIIFIDEIDSIGRSRKRKLTSNEDGENTLNTLLSRMDGFSGNRGIIVIGATNRIEILDEALLRPGRFDRHISVDLPVLKDRKEIFSLYLKKIQTGKNIDLDLLAEQTAGFSCAKIANVCNEAALLAARKKAKDVTMPFFLEAIDREEMGIEKKSKKVLEKEKKMIAYHECGHAIVGWFLENCTPLLKVSIIPRGSNILGYAYYSNKEQFLKTKQELLDEMCSYLGGRVAEEMIFKNVSSGAENDLENVFRIAKNMITVFGMNESFGSLSIYNSNAGELNYVSEDTAKLIDTEIRNTVKKMYERTKHLLTEKKDLLENLAEEVLKKETLNKAEIEKILGPREPYFVG